MIQKYITNLILLYNSFITDGDSEERSRCKDKEGYIYRNEVKCNGSVAVSNLSVSIMPRKVRLLNTSGSLLGRRMREWER